MRAAFWCVLTLLYALVLTLISALWSLSHDGVRYAPPDLWQGPPS